MANPFDRFDEPAANPFDQFDDGGKSVTVQGKPDASAAETERLKQKWMQESGGTVERVKQNAKAWAKAATPYVRPVVEGGLAALGATIGGAGGALSGLGVGSIPGAVAGGALGYAGGKNIMDTISGDWAATPTEATTRSLKDLGTGAMFEMGGPVAAKLTTPLIRGTASVVRGAKSPIESSKRVINNLIEKSAAKRMEAAKTTSGPVSDQAAMNAAETAALQERIPGFQVGMGQASEDPATLALQRRLNMQNDTAKVLNAEQVMGNNQAISDLLKTALPEGSVDDVLAAIERQRGRTEGASAKAWSQADAAATALEGGSKQASGQTLREGAATVKGVLRQKASELYSAVPREMEIDSTPLYNSIKEIGGEFDPAFQRLSATPTGTMNRAKVALTPEPSPILGADGKPYNQPRIDQDIPERMTFGQLQDFRSQITQAERAAKASGDYELTYKLGKLREGTDATLKAAADTGAGEGVDALRIANKFYREEYVPTVRQGATSRVLATDRTGGSKVENALVGAEYFKPGPKGVEAAASFNRTFGGDKAAKEAIRDHAAQDLLTYARNPVTGEIQSNRVSAWLLRHKDALSSLKMGNEFNSVQSAAKIAENARAVEGQFNKSRFAKVIDQTDSDKAIEQLFSGANSKDTGNTMRHLLIITKGDQSAMDGLKRSFADMLVKKAQLSQADMAGNAMTSIAKGQKLLQQYDPAMRALYSPQELQALKDVQRAIEIGGRINKNVSGVAGSQTADLIQDAATLLPHGPKFGLLKMVFNKMASGYDSAVNDYVARAIYDPNFAKQLADTARISSTKGADAAAKKLQQDIGIAISSGLIAARNQDQ